MKERRDVTRTKKAIENAYIELIIRKGYEKITVNEVITLADVSRGTFYAHYKDIPDLQERVEDKVIKAIREACFVSEHSELSAVVRTQVEAIFDMFCNYKDAFRKLLHNKNNSRMFARIKGVLADSLDNSNISEEIGKRTEKLGTELICRFMAGAFVEGFIYWLENEDELQRSKAINIISGQICGGLIGSLEQGGRKTE